MTTRLVARWIAARRRRRQDRAEPADVPDLDQRAWIERQPGEPVTWTRMPPAEPQLRGRSRGVAEPDDRELLERAAARLDRLLADVPPGRWQVDGPWTHATGEQTGMVTAGTMRTSVVLGVPGLGTGHVSDPALAYIAAMGPPAGRALARWLQHAARHPDGPSPWAVAVAREILAESEGGSP